MYRFGSTARGTATESSDIDIAILSSARMPAQRRFDVQEALAARFEDLTFGAYARLNEERRGILDRVAAEQAVYGR